MNSAKATIEGLEMAFERWERLLAEVRAKKGEKHGNRVSKVRRDNGIGNRRNADRTDTKADGTGGATWERP